MSDTLHREHLASIFDAAVDAVHPSSIIPSVLKLYDDKIQLAEDIFPFNRFENVYIAGAGKATAAMAFEAEKILQRELKEGVIASRNAFDFPWHYVRAIEAGHPLPDSNSVMAGEEIIKLLAKLRQKDLMIFLLSGGASSMMMDLPVGCTLSDINTTFELLLNSGASIHEMNTVRKHLSELKGGQLVKKCGGATISCFIISDVVGNDMQVIGSGPTTGDDTTYQDAMNIIERYGLRKGLPFSIVSHIQKGIDGNISENPKPGDPVFRNTHNYIVADNTKALEAAKNKAAELGYDALVVSHSLSGNAEDAANEWVKTLTSLRGKNVCAIGGGETTVKVTGNGKGGRNQHFALAAAIALKSSKDISLLAAGTDGSDGPTDAAGAFVNSSTYTKASGIGMNAEEYLRENNSYNFFDAIGDLLKTGPTHTNVMDLVVSIVNAD